MYLLYIYRRAIQLSEVWCRHKTWWYLTKETIAIYYIFGAMFCSCARNTHLFLTSQFQMLIDSLLDSSALIVRLKKEIAKKPYIYMSLSVNDLKLRVCLEICKYNMFSSCVASPLKNTTHLKFLCNFTIYLYLFVKP